MSYFILYPDVILVKGALNTLLLDFRSKNYISINTEIADFLTPRTIELKTLAADDLEFIAYLVEHEYGLYCAKNELKNFEPINQKWDFPADITNAIIEIDNEHALNFDAVFEQLGELQCGYVELRLNADISLTRLALIVELLGVHGIHGIQLVMPFNKKVAPNYIAKLNQETNVFIYSVLMYNCSPNFESTEAQGATLFNYVDRPLTCLDCGNINETKFIVDIPFYAESLSHNTCLNRKISLTSNGDIKHCPSFKKSYGNIDNVKLAEVINQEEFTSLWKTNKDQIKVCRDCEFRRICTDCRAFVEDPKDAFSKPSKCSYNPYTGVWDNEKNSVILT